MTADGDSAAADAQRHEQGRAIYNFRCYFCHGYSGDARTLAASYLSPKPRNFIATDIGALSRETMLQVVTRGKPGTAMQGFASSLSSEEIALVVDFVREEFMRNKAGNTRYHTVENGWPDHDKYRIAFPFALGEINLDTPWEALTPQQQAGKRLFMNSCVSCHDRARVTDEGTIWDARPLSYPRNDYSHKDDAPPVDATSAASVYAIHDRPPQMSGLTAQQREGETLYQGNCAFCHAADGSGRNWIGSFLEPHPRDLTGDRVAGLGDAQLREVIRNGLPGTTMSAWKNVFTESQIEAVIAYINVAFKRGLTRSAQD